MIKKFRQFNIILAWVAILLTSGCAYTKQITYSSAKDLTLPEFSSSMGAEGENYEIGVFYYSVTLQNPGDNSIFISSVLPILGENFTERLISENIIREVKQTIAPRQFIEIEGELRFDFEGLSKQDIEDLGPTISKFKIYREDYLPIPGDL